MGFFFTQARNAKPAAVQRNVIPIHELQKLGCKACPRDTRKMDSPKFLPTGGGSNILIYLLGDSPSEEEDERGRQWSDDLGMEIMSKLRPVKEDIRSGFITQCFEGKDTKEEAKVATECCRPRVVADIEECRPLVVAGVGDSPLRWVTGLDSALVWRGTPIATKIGNHACWYYPLLSPFYVRRHPGSRWNENEIALRVDTKRLIEFADSQPAPPLVYRAPFDVGIEYITGQEPGDLARLAKALDSLLRHDCAIDLETNGLRTYIQDPRIYTVAVGTFERTVAFCLDHPDGWETEGQRKQAELLFLNFILRVKSLTAHNLAFELEWLAHRFGNHILRRVVWHDTMGMWHSLNERKGTKSLNDQCAVHFGFHLKDQSRVKPERLLEFPLPEVLRYNGMDTKWTSLLARHLMPKVDELPDYRADYERKIRTAATLIHLESRGLPVDFKYTEDQDTKLRQEAKDLVRKLDQCREVQQFERRFGYPLEPTNPNHVLKLMWDICQRQEAQRSTREGTKWTTDEEALAAVPEKEMPSAKLILEHRAISKLLGTYIEPILAKRIVSPDGCIHAKYSTMEAETSRLASEDPNVQNFPKRKHVEIRGAVYAGQGMWLVAIDFGQIEFRATGMASEDDNLVKYCWTGYDVHKAWAERMVQVYPEIKDWIVREFGVDWDEKGLKTLRQEAKNGWVFPQLFGSTTRSCAERLHLPEDIADDLGAEFWDEFPGVKKWQERTVRHYEKHLYVETLGGRRRRGPLSRNQIINHPIQGTSAEIVIDAMNAVSERAELAGDPYSSPVLNVHDDLTFLMPDDDQLYNRIERVAAEMCRPRHSFVNVPLIVEVSVGPRWNKLKELGVYRSDKLYNLRNPYA